MDNQLFHGGNFLDDVAQVCPLCGMMFNNTLTYQHHMQLHILSANAMLGNQPPPDPGIVMPTPATILDLMGGVSQHALSTGSGVPVVPPQAVFSGTAASMPPHMISPGVGLVTGPLPNMGLPQQPSGRAKEKKQKSQSVKSTSISSNTNTTSSAQARSGAGTFKSHENSSSTYISTFPKDLQKMEHISQKPPIAQHSQTKIPLDVFPSTAPQLDPLEALIFTSPVKTGAPGFDRQLSRKNTSSPQDSGNSISKESKKLFQPFVSADTAVTAGFVTKATTHFQSDSLLSPVKSGTSKAPLLDVLSTPQKISYHSNNENLLISPPKLPNTSSGEVRHFGMFKDSEIASVPIERKLDLPSKISSQDHDQHPSKSQYFPNIMDPLNISPKAGQSARKKDIDSLIKIPVHQGSLDHSSSSSPVPRPTLPSEFASFRADSARTMVSPKVSTTVPSDIIDSDSTSLSSKPHIFGGAAAAEVLPTAGVPSSTPPVFGSSVTNAGGPASLASPAIDITLGTGYFNALTQKFINPTFALGGDFNKPGTSTAGDPDGQKQKIYFENGVIMNQDYDKISDTNDEDNLERLIDDIDTKSEPIIDKGYSEIEDLLNEFNEKQEDMKNKSQLDDFMKNDDFLKNVIEDTSKSKVDTSIKVDEPAFNPPEEFEMNKSIITDILEQEKERIEKESTELENARLSGLINTCTATSTSDSVTVSSSTATSTVTSVSNAEPKVSTSADSEEKKEDDHVDFEIPKVGKLMKIRKYFQIQEQKRKEQTEKVTEIRVHEKTEAPPAEDKPQTILVQVSKRKKIEYGPYLNRQSLLEGKPKANIETTSPPKTHRPKPKPPIPEKRTFNLRERKTKTDFATLASTGSKTAETKKIDTKQKASENTEQTKSEKEIVEEVKDEKLEEMIEESVSKDVKIVTRNQEKKKETDSQVDKTKSKAAVKVAPKSNSEPVKDKDDENETKQKDIKSVLRTRSAKTEAENAESGKNLRKRSIKPPAAADVPCSKNKIKKSGESVQKVNTDSVQKANTDSEEKVTRSKSKIKTTPEKSGIKKCSVNLGEKYNEMKAKSLVDKSDNKEGNSTNNQGKCLTEELVCKMDVEESDNHVKTSELKSNASENDESKKPSVKEKEQTDTLETTEISEGLGIVDEEKISKKGEKLTDISEPKVTDEADKKENENVQLRESTSQKVGRKGNKSRHEKSSRKESNIFEKIDQTESLTKKRLSNKTDESQMVSITSTDNTDKKVTMKLKLGPNFQKAFELFNPKKRKHEAVSESGQTLEKETKKEQKVEKKFKDLVETDKFEDSKSDICVEKESKKEQKIEKKHRKAIETSRFKDSKVEISDEMKSKREHKIEKIIKDVDKSDSLKDSIPEVSVEKETKMEHKIEKKLKNTSKTERFKDPKTELPIDKEKGNELKIEKKLTDDVHSLKHQYFIPDDPVEMEVMKEQTIEKNFKDSGKTFEVKDSELEASAENVSECSMKTNYTIESSVVENAAIEKNDLDENKKDTKVLETQNKDLDNSFKSVLENENIGQILNETEIKQTIEKDLNKEVKEEKVVKKVKHSVENEFQRLVNEAMAEAQKEGETAKSKNLRRRINENVKYNVDESDDELDRIKMLQEEFFISSKGHKTTPKGTKLQGKGQGSKGKLKLDITGTKDSDTVKQQQAKKDVDVYDFTDTEMSDTEESTPKKLGFKPKYVTNLNLFGQKKPPFVSKPMSPLGTLKTDDPVESVTEAVSESAPNNDSENENTDASISYVGKTVEPLKIKLTKIIPFKEKKHKHKKKKRRREKERREDDIDKIDSESRDSVESGISKKNEDEVVVKSDIVGESENFEIKKIDEVKSVDSIGQESNSNSNEGEEEPSESGNSTRSNKRTKLKEKKHICEYCNVGFGQKCDLRRHVMIHTGERPYPCQICDKRFQRKTDLVKHTRTHTGEKPYACEFCDKRVSDKSQLNVHRRLHTGDRPYCCSNCGKRCITSSELSRHMAVHCTEKVERCSLCKKAFTMKECLGMHMKLHYRSRGKSFKCEKCAIGFDKKIDLDNHHCVDPISSVYVCSECYETFRDEMLYAEHIKTHDLGVLACNVCTNIFEDKHSLESHLCSMGVEKQKQLACEICETEFQDQDLLNQHMISHDSDEGAFMCDFCSEVFKVRKLFNEHTRQHDIVLGPSVGNSPRPQASSVPTSQTTESGQSLSDIMPNNVEIGNRKEREKFATIKQEIDSNDFQFLSAGHENISNRKENARNIKAEMFEVLPGLPSNRSRASVISGTFRIDDESGDSRQSNAKDRPTFPRGNLSDENFINLSDKSAINRTSNNARSPDFLDSDRFFEAADFTNSPDFSTLTESDDLDLSPFESVSNSLNKDSEKSAKLNQNTSAKQIDCSASIDLKQKIMKRFGTNSQSYGTIPVSNSRVTTRHGLLRQSSARNLPLQNSQISALLSSDTTPTHSSDSSQNSNRGHLHRSTSAGHTSHFPNSQNDLSHGDVYQQNSQNKRWPGFQLSGTDFANSLDSLGYESKSYGDKSDHFTQGLSKSMGSSISLGNGGNSFNKDNIENQMKSDMFPEFDVSPNKPAISPNSFGNSSASAFPGVNPNSFSPRQFIQSFQEKSDYSSFGQPFLGTFPQTSTFASNVTSSSLKSNVSADGPYSLDTNVTPDVNKRHLQGIYSGRSDIVQNTPFYLSGIDDSIKDLAGSDKDETTALLSNFDQF